MDSHVRLEKIKQSSLNRNTLDAKAENSIRYFFRHSDSIKFASLSMRDQKSQP